MSDLTHSINSVQYSGVLQDDVRKLTKALSQTEDSKFERIFEEEKRLLTNA